MNDNKLTLVEALMNKSLDEILSKNHNIEINISFKMKNGRIYYSSNGNLDD